MKVFAMCIGGLYPSCLRVDYITISQEISSNWVTGIKLRRF